MHWLGAIIGAVLGLMFGAADSALLGLLLGALIGWQSLRLIDLRSRLEALESSSRATLRHQTEEARGTHSTSPVYPSAAAIPDSSIATDAASVGASVPSPSVAPSATKTPVSASVSGNDEQVVENPWLVKAGGEYRGADFSTPSAADVKPSIAARIGKGFMDGNVPVKLGSLVLFAGIAAALKYAADQGMLSMPIEARLTGFALAALLMLAWGWRRRTLQPTFGLSLQGAGIGVALMTVFAAFRLYQVLPASAAFAITLALVICASLLALLQNSLALAVLGLLAGYLAPLLISTGTGNHVALFSYYLILNGGVLLIAWVRPWRALNLIAFGFTFAVMSLWAWSLYQPANFVSIEPFLIAYFLFFTAIPVLYALRQTPRRRGLVDGTLVFGTPLLAYPMQAALLEGDAPSLAVSALAMAGFYALLAAWLLRSRGIELLAHSFAVLAVGFATLAIPLALAAPWTVAIWSLEGAALIWLGLRQQQRLPQLAGALLQILAAAAYLVSLADNAWRHDAPEWLLLNSHGLSLLMMAAAALTIAWLYDQARSRQRWQVWPAFVAGLFWWTLAGAREIDVRLHGYDAYLAMVLLLALSVALSTALRKLIPWARLGWILPLATLAALFLALATALPDFGLFNWPGFPVWALTLTVLLIALRFHRHPWQRGLASSHIMMLWTLALILGIGLQQHASNASLWNTGAGWHPVAMGLPLALLLAASRLRADWVSWPLNMAYPSYQWRWELTAALALGLLFALSLSNHGDSTPLSFLPLLNPLEMFQLGLLLAMAIHLYTQRSGDDDQQGLLVLWALAAFAFISFAGLRAVHQLAGVPWSPQILDNAIAQAVLTLSWSAVGVSAWILGSRRNIWPIWLGGAVLMGLVLLKLIVVDRQYMGGIAGIVSFMAVGALLVVVGRIAPTPARRGLSSETGNGAS